MGKLKYTIKKDIGFILPFSVDGYINILLKEAKDKLKTLAVDYTNNGWLITEQTQKKLILKDKDSNHFVVYTIH